MQRVPRYNHVEIYHLLVKLFTYLHNVQVVTQKQEKEMGLTNLSKIWAIKRAVCFNICYQLTENLIGV